MLAAMAVLYAKLTGRQPHFWKADVDKAYRRIPVHPEHRWMLTVAFLLKDEVWTAQHNTMAFGLVASVHRWDSVWGLHALPW